MIERIADGARIPPDPENKDYAEFLRWLEDGNTILPYVSTETLEDLRKRAFDEIREVRAPMLNAVTGIGVTALIDGNEAEAAEAKLIRQKLLEITADAALNAATTYESMKLAGRLAYRKIAKAASPAFAAVFKETTGA
ncbi:hypothetical protein FDI24_gp190 [Acidovorax phage ACP17]|uniref:Uncharacterized protein n=1 Tax=Acidovorax phage ACP17 TaxID=2010329 RepID=A0A218M340_9CAUD|nr:hypothetical protein FDI24_gp190 [Acidovorax phage ACP17]ASD50472.1 hypothetical protein [Acidovorax phage ACP17]